MLDLEETVQEAIEYTNGAENEQIQKLLHKIRAAKKEFDFYDTDAELDNMFPDRNDDDFDEDSLSYDSVVGDD